MTIKNNKFIGYFQTETEYRPHECVILSYAIQLNPEGTSFDYSNTLVVDLTAMSESSAEYLRDVAHSGEAATFKTFIEFAHGRIFSGRQETILEYLHNSNYIRKVPSDKVLLLMGAAGSEREVFVSEINESIKAAVEGAKVTPESVAAESVETKPMLEAVIPPVKEKVPFIERTPEYTYTPVATTPTLVETGPTVAEEISALRSQVDHLTKLLETALEPKKAGRPRKE